MNKILIVCSLLFFLRNVEAQSAWPPIGMKWWYSNNESQSGFLYKNQGYAEYECQKDTLLGTDNVKKITKHYYYTNGKDSTKESIYIKVDNNIAYYRNIDDIKWYFFNHLSPQKNIEFDALFKGIRCVTNKDTIIKLKIIDTSDMIINSKKVKTYGLSSVSNTSLGFDLSYSQIGNSYTFIPEIYNNNIFDCGSLKPNPMRCVESNSLSGLYFTGYLNFDIDAKDCKELYITLINESKIKNKEINIYPNPSKVGQEVHISNWVSKKDLEVYNSTGNPSNIEINNDSETIIFKEIGIYILKINNKHFKLIVTR